MMFAVTTLTASVIYFYRLTMLSRPFLFSCESCLDRSNVAQFSAGVAAISQQLVVMGIRSQSHLDSSSNIVRVLIDM